MPRCDWSQYTAEQKAKYNERKRLQYAERGAFYEKIRKTNAAWRLKNREEQNRKRAERRRHDPVWRDAQNAKRRGRDQREDQLKTHYGLTKAEYEAMHAAQEGLCGICRSKTNQTLCVDHCHTTGKVRALLCRACNTGLGCFRDDITLFGLAVSYLEKWR